MARLMNAIDNLEEESDEVKLIIDSPTSSSSDNECDSSSCRDSISSDIHVRKPKGMVKSMFRRLRVSSFLRILNFKTC